MEELVKALPAGEPGNPTRFLWYHAAEIAGYDTHPVPDLASLF